jgi:hypothetical protein
MCWHHEIHPHKMSSKMVEKQAAGEKNTIVRIYDNQTSAL